MTRLPTETKDILKFIAPGFMPKAYKTLGDDEL
jgi:hypothetical protein